MNEYFRVYTYTPWDGTKSNQLAEVSLISFKSVFRKYPIIEKKFFSDLSLKLNQYPQYSSFETIRRIVGPQKEDYDISTFRFIWAYDMENRMYQFLIQMIENTTELSQAAIVGLAPPELAKLFSDYKENAIHRIFTLLNDPSMIKFLMYFRPRGKSIAEDVASLITDKQKLEKMNYMRSLANQPNIQGQWFPTFELRCPSCDKIIAKVTSYQASFGNMKCPFCGYKEVKNG